MNTQRMRRTALVGAIVVLALIGGVAAAGGRTATHTAQQLPGSIAYSAGSQHRAIPFEVYLAQPDGTITQLTHAATRHAFPAWPVWSPDGSRLLVEADDGIYVVRADGSSEIRVSPASASSGGAATWSPDSRTIAFRKGDALYVVDADGSAAPRLLTNRTSNSFPFALSWSPSGRQILYAGAAKGRSAVFLVNTDGAPRPKKIVIRPRPSNPREARVYRAPGYRAATWSPDGSRIAFQWDDGRAKCCVNDWIYVMRPDGTGVTRLHRGWIGPWSPDGRKIAFTEGVLQNDVLSVINADGTGLRRLCDRHFCDGTTWLPDGSKLAYLTHHDQELVIVGADGSSRRIVARPSGAFSLSPDASTVAYVAGKRPNWNRNLYVIRADGSGRRLVAHSSTLRFWAPSWRPTSRARTRATAMKKGSGHE